MAVYKFVVFTYPSKSAVQIRFVLRSCLVRGPYTRWGKNNHPI